MSEVAPVTPDRPIREIADEAMIASITRNAFARNIDILPLWEPGVLEKGNQSAQATHGNNTRELILLGSDVVMFDFQPPVVLERRHAAEFLAALISERRLAPIGDYLKLYPIYRNISGAATRTSAARGTRSWLDEVLEDRNSEPITTGSGVGRGSKYGTPDIVVHDARRTKEYQATKHEIIKRLCLNFINEGGEVPLTHDALARRAAWELFAEQSTIQLSQEQDDRFTLLWQQTPDQAVHGKERITLPALSPDIKRRVQATVGAKAASSWKDEARCQDDQGQVAAVFHTQDGEGGNRKKERIKEAKEICKGCDVQKPCLETALGRGETQGIWAGLDFAVPDNRRRATAIVSR